MNKWSTCISLTIFPAYRPQASSTTRSAPSVATPNATTWTAFLNELMLNGDLSYFLLYSKISENYLFMLQRLEKRYWRHKKQRAISSDPVHFLRIWMWPRSEWKREWRRTKPTKKKFFLTVQTRSALALVARWAIIQGYNRVTYHVLLLHSQWWRNHVWQPHN